MDIRWLLEKHFKKKMEPDAVTVLKGDASSRRYYRIELPRGTSPRTMVLMELPEGALKSDEATCGTTPAELPFLNVGRCLKARGLRVPEVYLDAVENGALLLEDLGDVLFFDKISGQDLATMRSWYSAAVDLLVEMHRRMWPIPEGCQAADKTFGYDLLRWELDHYREWGLEALRGTPLETARRVRLDAVFDELAGEVSTLPRGFVHRDYQSRNLMVIGEMPADRNLAIIDFQDAFEGPRVYDLVALLNDSYVDLPDELKEEMLRRYASGAGIDADQLREEFHLTSVQRKLKDGGRFVFIDRVKGNSAFLPYVEGSFVRVRASLKQLPGHEELKRLLAELDPVFQSMS